MFKTRTLMMLVVTFGFGAWWSLKAVEQRIDPTPAFIDATAAANFSQIEKGLFMGGQIPRPPSGAVAVLNLSDFEDAYKVKYHKQMAIPDAEPAPSLDWLREAVKFVDHHRAKNRPTFVHCYAGISRSGLVVTAHLMQKHNWTRDEALAFVRKSRPIANPNPAFMELLLEWEKTRP